MNSILRKIKYKLAKREYIRDKKCADLTETQTNVINIYKNILSKFDSTMLVAPISGKKYLKWKDMTAILKNGTIIIINHKYYYNVQVPNYYIDKLNYKFDCKLERRRNKMEQELDNDINESLNKILDYLKIGEKGLSNA